MANQLRTRQSGGTVPQNISAPTLSGTQTVGQVLTCNPGVWTGLNPVTLTFQWFRDVSTPIGTNSNQYTLVVGDSTHTVKCQVTITNALGNASAQTPNTVTIP